MKQTNKLKLTRVTLVAVTSVNITATISAMKYSMRGIDYGDCVLITHKKPWNLPSTIRYCQVDKIDSIDKFNHFMVYDLWEYVHTDYIMLVHADGFVIHPEMWQEEFLNYDYIGAPWPLPDNPISYRDINGNICRVGNSVSLRSYRLLKLPSEEKMEWKPQPMSDGGVMYNEDTFICVANKHIFEEHGMKIAPLDIAKYFAHERTIPETIGITPFAFHKWAGANKSFPGYYKYIEFVRGILKKIKGRLVHRMDKITCNLRRTI